MSTAESVRIPTAAIIVAIAMNSTYVDREVGALADVLLDLLPQDGVGRRARARAPSPRARRERDGRVDGLERDRPLAVEPERAELLDDEADLLARDVAEHDVADRLERRHRGGGRCS